MKELCGFLLKLMNESSGYFVEMDTYTSFILKMVGSIDGVKNWFVSNSEAWGWVVGWLGQHQVPPIGMTQSNVTFFGSD